MYVMKHMNIDTLVSKRKLTKSLFTLFECMLLLVVIKCPYHVSLDYVKKMFTVRRLSTITNKEYTFSMRGTKNVHNFLYTNSRTRTLSPVHIFNPAYSDCTCPNYN